MKIKDNIYIFYWVWDRTNKKEKFFAQKINLETCEFAEKPIFDIRKIGKTVLY